MYLAVWPFDKLLDKLPWLCASRAHDFDNSAFNPRWVQPQRSADLVANVRAEECVHTPSPKVSLAVALAIGGMNLGVGEEVFHALDVGDDHAPLAVLTTNTSNLSAISLAIELCGNALLQAAYNVKCE